MTEIEGGSFWFELEVSFEQINKNVLCRGKNDIFRNLVLSKLFQLIDSCWIRLGTSIFCRRRRCIRHMTIFGEWFHVRCYLSISNFLKNLFFFSYESEKIIMRNMFEKKISGGTVWSEKNFNCRENLRFAKISALMAPKPEHSSLRFICITRFQSCHMYIKQLLFSSSFILKNKLTVYPPLVSLPAIIWYMYIPKKKLNWNILITIINM